jgi:hypothetical protein
MKDQEFKNTMQHSKLDIPFSDFEENVMEKVRKKEAIRRSVWRNLKISWIFFFIGTFLGILVTHYFTTVKISFLEENSELVLLLAEILIVIVISTQFDNLIRFTFKKR